MHDRKCASCGLPSPVLIGLASVPDMWFLCRRCYVDGIEMSVAVQSAKKRKKKRKKHGEVQEKLI